jgi:sugar lactone lactonase YvrE
VGPLEIWTWALAALLTLLLLGCVSATTARAECEGECTPEQAETGLAEPPAWAAGREIHFEAESAEASAYTAEEMEAGESESETQVGPLEYRESGKGVQGTPKVYVIFWGKNFMTTEAGEDVEILTMALLEGLSGSAYQGLLTQYFDSGGTISPTLKSITAYPDESVTAPKEINQVKVEEEITSVIKNQKWEVEPDAQFLLVSAPGSTYEAEFAEAKGCAYHGVIKKSGEADIIYGFVPYQGDPPYSKSKCISAGNPGKDPLLKTSKSVSHEYADAVTDPYPGVEATSTWRDFTKSTLPEIGDMCQLETGFTLPSGGYAQNLYDNHLHACSHSDLEPPHAYAITDALSVVTSEKATLKGRVNPVGLESEYYFEYGETESYGSKTAKVSTEESGFKDQSVSKAVSSLKPSTTYHYRVVTTNSTGTTSGQDRKFTTGTGKAPIVSTASATGVEMFEAILRGTVNPNGFATTDQFDYGLTESYGSSTPSESAGSGSAEVAKGYTLTHLTPNKTYYFRLKASNSKGSGEGEKASFKTKALEPAHATSVGSKGTGNGQFKHPAGVVSDGQGNIWIVDMENGRLQKFNEKGEYLTQFGKEGTGKCELNRPKSVAVDSEGHIWVDDAGNYRVTEFNEAGECFTQFGGPGTEKSLRFDDAESIAIDHKNDIWVADTYGQRLMEFDHEGKFIKVVQPASGKSCHMENPGGITIDPAGNVWVVDWLGNRVIEFNEEGSCLSEFPFKGEGSGEGQFKHPDAIAVDANGAVWVCDEGNGRVQVFNEAGEYITKFGSVGSGAEQFNFEYPMGILSEGSGEVWITDAKNNRMEKWTIPSLTPTYSSSFGSKGVADGQFEEPAGIAVNPMNGNLAVSDEVHGRVEVFSEAGTYITKFGKNGSSEKEFKEPRGVAIDAEGNIWVTDTGNNRVQEFTEDGIFIRKFGTKGSGDGEFKSPKGLGIDSKGNVWVADSENDRVQEFDKEGKYQRKFSTGTNPIGVAVDPKGNVWSTNEEETGVIEEHTETGKLMRKMISSGKGIGQLLKPRRLAIGINGELWIPDAGNNRVEVFNQKGEYITKFGTSGSDNERMNFPVALALDVKGNIWVTDNKNQIDHWIR